jgi:hypothetical protein
VAGAEPERELIRRISPFALPVGAAAFGIGALIAGPDAGWSAAIGIAVVYLNFVAHGWSLAAAAAISPVLLYAVGLGGFIVRLGLILVLIVLLRQFDWFSTVAFIAALVPGTIALLAVEMKMLSGRLQADMWTFPASGSPAGGTRR